MSKIIKVRDQNTGQIFGSLVCNKQIIISSEYKEEEYTSDNKILLDQDEIIEEDDDYEKIIYIESFKEDKEINNYEVLYFDIETKIISNNNNKKDDKVLEVKNVEKKNCKEKQSNDEDNEENDELEVLQDKLDNQKYIFTKLVKNSLESLKLVGKIFSLKTDKKNFIQNSIEKLKTKIEQKKNEDNDQLESFELKLKTHFWNIHEVYLNLLKKQQDKVDQFTHAIKQSCQSFSEYQNKIIFEGCCNQQRIEYIRDLFLKFVQLGDSDKLYKEVISAMLDVFDMKPVLKQKFFDNLKKIQLIKQSIQSMEQTEKKFLDFNKNFQKESDDFNLNCICVQETYKLVMITAFQQFTKIKNAIVFKKKKKRIKSISPNEIKINKNAKKYNFSLFIGNLIIKNQNFLIFAQKVKNCNFDDSKKNIFQIASIKIIAMDQCEDISLYEESFNKIFQKGFYFSYNIDLTYPLNQKKHHKQKQPKWIFYVNRGMHRIFQNNKLNEWITPVVFGDMGMINRHSFDGKGFQFSYFKRISIIDMLQKDLKDPLIANFTVSNSFQQYDFQYIAQNKTKLFISFVVSNIYDSSSDFKKVLRYFNFLSHKFKIKEFFATYNAETNFENSLNIMESFPYLVRMLKVSNLLDIYYSFNKYIKSYLDDKNSVFSISVTKEDNFNEDKLYCLMACFVCFCNANVDDQKEINFNEDEKLIEEIQLYSQQELQKSKEVVQDLKNIILGVDKSKKIVKQIRIMFISLLNQQYPADQIRKNKVFKLSKTLMNLIYGNFFDDMEDLIKNYKIEDKNLFNPTNLKIAFLTHNCQGYLPIKNSQKNDLKWIQNEDINNSDILILGFQEIIEMKSKNLQRIVLEYSESHTKNWVQFFKANLNKEYKLFYHKNLVGLLLFIFIKENQFNNYMFKIQNVVIERLGKLNMANKGAILIQLDINFQTFTFINCHLESGTNLQKAFIREENFSKLVETSNSLSKSFGIFILGDMNFRNYTTYQDILNLKFKMDNNFEQIFVDNDELKQSQLLERFKYKEMKIQFNPSYKFKQNSNEYYVKKGKRIPSYTDRIVYNTLEDDIFKPLKYFKDKNTIISDHRPVILIGNLKILQFDTQKFQNILDQLRKQIKFFIYLQMIEINFSALQQKIRLQVESIQIQVNKKTYNIKYDDVIGLGKPKQRISSNNEYKSYFYYFQRIESLDHKNRKYISSNKICQIKICSLDDKNLKNLRLRILNWFHKFYNRNLKQDEKGVIYYRKALCFVNPHSGPGKARKLYDQYKDLLFANGIYIDKHETQIAPFIGEFLKNMSKKKILSYDFFMTISGDGTIYELFNGYYKRKDIDFKKNPLKISQIPGGSGCLLFHNSSKLSNTPSNIQQSIYAIIHPQTRQVYLKQISCKSFDGTIRKFFYFLYVAQGVIGDSCVKSEGLRCIGASRFLVYGVYNSLFPSWYQLKGYLALNNTWLPDISQPITIDKNIQKLEGKYSHFIGSAQPYININTLMNPNLIQQPKKIDFHSFNKKKGRIEFIKYMSTYNKFNPEKPRGCYQTLTNSYRVIQNTQNRLVVVDGEDFTKFNIKEYQLDATDLFFITYCQLYLNIYKILNFLLKILIQQTQIYGTQKYSIDIDQNL